MLKHRRIRILLVLLVSWAATAGVERFGGELPWPTAAAHALLWAVLVAFVWWFAEWTQVQRRRPDRTTTDAVSGRSHPVDRRR